MPELDNRDSTTTGDQHARIPLGDGGCLVYDRENPRSWIQATTGDSVREVRP